MNGNGSDGIDPDSDYIDLDAEVVHLHGERIIDARAAQMAEDAERLARDRYPHLR